MKHRFLRQLVIASLAATIGGAGCHTTPKKDAPVAIPNQGKGTPISVDPKKEEVPNGNTPTPGQEVKTTTPETTKGTGLVPLTGAGEWTDFNPDRATLQTNTIYFEYDSATIKKSETKNLDAVAKYLKGAPADKVGIEGNCDERGTPEYNRALGERRAQAAREYLVKTGKIAGDRILTKSFGDQRPASPGHDEASRAKNRRDEFVVLKPKS